MRSSTRFCAAPPVRPPRGSPASTTRRPPAQRSPTRIRCGSPSAGSRSWVLTALGRSCATPGDKTPHLAALMRGEGEIVAVEADPGRAKATTENAARLGAASVRVVVGNAADPAFGKGYDRVLVDPPCSDLGTLQSRPDARWRKTPEQVSELRALQRRILAAAAAAVRVGGRLVYSTCTISASENERLVQEFLDES